MYELDYSHSHTKWYTQLSLPRSLNILTSVWSAPKSWSKFTTNITLPCKICVYLVVQWLVFAKSLNTIGFRLSKMFNLFIIKMQKNIICFFSILVFLWKYLRHESNCRYFFIWPALGSQCNTWCIQVNQMFPTKI